MDAILLQGDKRELPDREVVEIRRDALPPQELVRVLSSLRSVDGRVNEERLSSSKPRLSHSHKQTVIPASALRRRLPSPPPQTPATPSIPSASPKTP